MQMTVRFLTTLLKQFSLRAVGTAWAPINYLKWIYLKGVVTERTPSKQNAECQWPDKAKKIKKQNSSHGGGVSTRTAAKSTARKSEKELNERLKFFEVQQNEESTFYRPTDRHQNQEKIEFEYYAIKA